MAVVLIQVVEIFKFLFFLEFSEGYFRIRVILGEEKGVEERGDPKYT